MRYLGQNYELELPVGFDALRPTATVEQLWQALPRRARGPLRLRIPGEIIEIVNYTVTALSRTAQARAAARSPPADGAAERRGRAPGRASSAGGHDVPVYRRDDLRAGHAHRRARR